MKEIEIPEGYEARIKGNKVIIEPVESEDEKIRKEIILFLKDASNCKTRVVDSETFAKWAAYLEKQKALSELGKYIAAERTKPEFIFSGNDSVSWEELPLQVRKHDYPYYFIGDLDCYPFVVEEKKLVECSKNNKDKSILTILVNALKGNAQLEWELKSAGVDVKKLVAYIEEQTEELSIRLNGLMQEYVYAGKDEEEQEHRLKCYQLFWDALGDSEFFKQKEQNPIFRVGDNIIAKDGTCIPKEPFHIERIKDDCYWDGNNSILICNQDDFQLIDYHHAEWSEEDEKMLDKVCCLISPGTILNAGNADYCLELKQWIVSLQERILKLSRTQPKQEWSEEDNDSILIAIDWMRFYRDRFAIYKETKDEINTCIKRLNSLRSCPKSSNYWKPSEEQMEALKNCAYGAFQNGDGPVLRELYNDLKKL